MGYLDAVSGGADGRSGGKRYNHPDFMIIESEDGKSLKIEQIRYLQEKISEKPIGGNKKIYIIGD